MSNTEHTAGAAHRSFRCAFGPVREVDLVCPPPADLGSPKPEDLVWPPPDEDVDAFTVVRLDGSDAEPPRLEPPILEAVLPEPVRLKPRRIKPTFGDCRAVGAAPRVRPLVVPMEPPPLPEPAVPDLPAVAAPPAALPEDAHVAAAEVPPPLLLTLASATPKEDPETTGAGRSAWLAVFFAAACALVTFVEYHAPVTLPVGASEAPPALPDFSVADVPAPVARAVPPSALPKPAATGRPATSRIVAAAPRSPIPAPAPKPAAAPVSTPAPAPRFAAVTPRRDVEPPPHVTPRVTVDVRDRGAVVTPAPAPSATPPPAAAAAARPEPLAKAAPSPATPTPVAAVLTDSASDEDDIRSTLTRFRTAYSKLDAGAARDVWPSVDARALERAFQSLKSQDLRFDSCKMTVTGARAQAACKGRAVYVPRIGDQSPRYTSREWNFELRKADERWTIASARSL